MRCSRVWRQPRRRSATSPAMRFRFLPIPRLFAASQTPISDSLSSTTQPRDAGPKLLFGNVATRGCGSPKSSPNEHNLRLHRYAEDNCAVTTCQITITSNEPVNGTRDSDSYLDWEI